MTVQGVQRIRRNREAASEAALGLRESTDPAKGQELWERFLVHWRMAWEQASSLCRAAGIEAISMAHHNLRVADPVATYAWEARNAESHDHLGSSDARYGTYIQHPITVGGEAVTMGGVPVVLGLHEDILVAVPVTTKRGEVVKPPDGLEPAAIALKALASLDDFLAEALPTAE